MSNMINVAVDAMGGDNAPGVTVQGAVEAVNDITSLKVYLVGLEDRINDELAKYT